MVRLDLQGRVDAWRARLPLEITLALAIGFVLALLGPYDTAKFPLLPRTGYWVGLITAWFLLCGLVDAAIRPLLSGRRWGALAVLAATCLMTALPMTGLVWAASVELTKGAEVLYPLQLYGQTLLIGGGASLIGDALFPRLLRPAEPLVDAVGEAAVPRSGIDDRVPVSLNRLEARLPPALQGAIRALASEDHYVRIFTASGSHILLMRLSDAIEQIDDAPGERVHRSWWVAASAPCEFVPRGRTAVLRVADVGEVPVSTPYLKIAEELAARARSRD